MIIFHLQNNKIQVKTLTKINICEVEDNMNCSGNIVSNQYTLKISIVKKTAALLFYNS